MASIARDLVGLEAYARDGAKLGKVVEALADVSSRGEYIAIKKRFRRSLVVPTDVLEVRDDSIIVPFTSSFLDMAPQVRSGEQLSGEESAQIDSFYHAKAA